MGSGVCLPVLGRNEGCGCFGVTVGVLLWVLLPAWGAWALPDGWTDGQPLQRQRVPGCPSSSSLTPAARSFSQRCLSAASSEVSAFEQHRSLRCALGTSEGASRTLN